MQLHRPVYHRITVYLFHPWQNSSEVHIYCARAVTPAGTNDCALAIALNLIILNSYSSGNTKFYNVHIRHWIL